MPKLPPRYAFRLDDLRVWHVVEAACPCCRHRAVIDHARLTRGRSGSMKLVDLEMKLRCPPLRPARRAYADRELAVARLKRRRSVGQAARAVWSSASNDMSRTAARNG